MKKGFTIIELLAVLVILAIIALIAVPIVLNIINNARESSKLKSAEFYIDAVNQAVVRERMNGIKINNAKCTINNNGYLNCEGIDKEIRIDTEGDMPVSGEILIENGLVKKNINTYVVFNDNQVIFALDGNLVFLPSKSFAEDSWETIVANVKLGNISNYKVGDVKEITLTSTDTNIAGTYTVRVANTSTPEECRQSGFSQTACGFVIEFVDIITERGMNSTNTNVGGWRDSEMRSYVNNEIYNSLPSVLKNNIINTTVISEHRSSDTSSYTTTDKLYLLEKYEVYASTSNLTRQLDYYKNIHVSDPINQKFLNGLKCSWWLRTDLLDFPNHYFEIVDVYGDYSISNYNASIGVAPAFRIGIETTEPESGYICKLESGTSKSTSAQYTCTLDQDRTFYVLGENANDSNKIDLIMDQNYVDDTVPSSMTWCVSGEPSSCNHDGLDPYIEYIQGVFGDSVTVSLPTRNQIYKASGNKNYEFPLWLYDNQVPDATGYWTSTGDDTGASFVSWYGTFGGDDTGGGIRPVITISKSNME